MLGTHTVHIAGRGSVVRPLRPDWSGLASQFRVLRTGTLSDSEVSERPDNMYQPLAHQLFFSDICRNFSSTLLAS